MHDFLLSSDEKFSQRAIRVQQAINFCAAHSEIILKKEGGRDAVSPCGNRSIKLQEFRKTRRRGKGMIVKIYLDRMEFQSWAG